MVRYLALQECLSGLWRDQARESLHRPGRLFLVQDGDEGALNFDVLLRGCLSGQECPVDAVFGCVSGLMGSCLPLEAGGHGLQDVFGHPAGERADLVEFLVRWVYPLLSGPEERPKLLALLLVASHPIVLLVTCECKNAVVRSSCGVQFLQRVTWGPDHCVEGILGSSVCCAGFDVP